MPLASHLYRALWADDPFRVLADRGTEFALLLGLTAAAVAVIWYSSRLYKNAHAGNGLGSRLRLGGRSTGNVSSDARWRETVRMLQEREPTSIADAKPGPVRIRGRIVTASGTLGGAEGRECVWRNRLGGRPEAAVCADLIVVADASGHCGIEDLASARIIARAEETTRHIESVSLCIGDELDVVGSFNREDTPNDAGPDHVYGTINARPGLEIRRIDPPRTSSPVNPSEPGNEIQSS
jgi:hypothetical protein